MSYCTLCKSREADKKNSHIISKFLGKELYDQKGIAIEIGKGGRNKKIQDTIKESYIFCKYCEKRMEKIETLFSKKLQQIYNHQNHPEKFNNIEFKGQKYLESLDIHPSAYKLFFYLQVWRLSISKSYHYENFKFENDLEELLRRFLNANLQHTHSELIDRFDSLTDVPDLLSCLVISNERGIYTAYQFGEGQYIMVALHFTFMLFIDPEKAEISYKLFGNRDGEKIKIVIGNKSSWKVLNETIINKLFKSQLLINPIFFISSFLLRI